MTALKRKPVKPSPGVNWSEGLNDLVAHVNSDPGSLSPPEWNKFKRKLREEDPDAYALRQQETQRRKLITVANQLTLSELEKIVEDKREEARAKQREQD